MRYFALIVTLFLLGCPQQQSAPMDVCGDYENACVGDFECVGFRCIARCSYSGDCDPGFRCDSGSCLEECESDGDCTIGTCNELGEGRRGKACSLTDLPECAEDFHCSGNVCVDGTCKRWCVSDSYCGVGSICKLDSEGVEGYCTVDPDYEPPPPPETCAEASVPDSWCAEQWDNTYHCNLSEAVCQPTYQAVLIRDSTDECLEQTEPSAPGADILGMRAYERDGAQANIYLSVYSQGTGTPNEHTEWAAVETLEQPMCTEDTQLSLGCGGFLLVVVDGTTTLGQGWTLEVTEDGALCEDAAPDESAEVYLCKRFPSIETPENDCQVWLGSLATQSMWTLP